MQVPCSLDTKVDPIVKTEFLKNKGVSLKDFVTVFLIAIRFVVNQTTVFFTPKGRLLDQPLGVKRLML